MHTSLLVSYQGQEVMVDAGWDQWKLMRLPKVWKDPGATMRLAGLAKRGQFPSHVLVPVRWVADAAASRLRNERPWFPHLSEDFGPFYTPIGAPKLEGAGPKQTQGRQEWALRATLGALVEVCVLHGIPITFVPWYELPAPNALWRRLEQGGVVELLGLQPERFHAAHAEVWEDRVEVWRD